MVPKLQRSAFGAVSIRLKQKENQHLFNTEDTEDTEGDTLQFIVVPRSHKLVPEKLCGIRYYVWNLLLALGVLLLCRNMRCIVALLFVSWALVMAAATDSRPCELPMPAHQVTSAEEAVGWSPDTCWGCENALASVGWVILGYFLGIPLGFSGFLRRRYNKLDASVCIYSRTA